MSINYETVSKQMIHLNSLTHYNINGEKQEIITSKYHHNFNIKTVFTAYREFQRCFRVYNLTQDGGGEEEESHSRGAVGSGPLRFAGA